MSKRMALLIDQTEPPRLSLAWETMVNFCRLPPSAANSSYTSSLFFARSSWWTSTPTSTLALSIQGPRYSRIVDALYSRKDVQGIDTSQHGFKHYLWLANNCHWHFGIFGLVNIKRRKRGLILHLTWETTQQQQHQIQLDLRIWICAALLLPVAWHKNHSNVSITLPLSQDPCLSHKHALDHWVIWVLKFTSVPELLSHITMSTTLVSRCFKGLHGGLHVPCPLHPRRSMLWAGPSIWGRGIRGTWRETWSNCDTNMIIIDQLKWRNMWRNMSKHFGDLWRQFFVLSRVQQVAKERRRYVLNLYGIRVDLVLETQNWNQKTLQYLQINTVPYKSNHSR